MHPALNVTKRCILTIKHKTENVTVLFSCLLNPKTDYLYIMFKWQMTITTAYR